VEDCRRVSWAATALGAPRVCQAWSSRLGMTMRVPVFRALATAWAVSRRRALRRRRWGLGASGRGFAGGLRRRD
jgi:hypothetical protein